MSEDKLIAAYEQDANETHDEAGALRRLVVAARVQAFADLENEVRRRMGGGIWLSEPLMLQLIKELSGKQPTPSR